MKPGDLVKITESYKNTKEIYLIKKIHSRFVWLWGKPDNQVFLETGLEVINEAR